MNHQHQEALLPCPHCGHTEAPCLTDSLEFQDEIGGEFDESNAVYFAVVCSASKPGGPGGCGAMGGFAPTKEQAVELWNRRASTPPAPTGAASRAEDLEALDETKQFHAFLQWANEEGQDIAYTYDTDRSKWVCLNPMTADSWKSWSACAALLRQRLESKPDQETGSLALHSEGGEHA